MRDYLLGIDVGATVAKVVIFDLQGQAIRHACGKSAVAYPRPGWTERSMVEIWDTTAAAIRTVIADAGISAAAIAAIGACGHGNGLYLLDRHGAPLRPTILSMDTRAIDVVDAWRAQSLLDTLWPRILQTPYAAQPPALLRWLKLNQPEVYARIGAVLLAKDYINQRLTGAIATDLTDISATGLLDLGRRDYAPDLLDAYGIPEIAAALPPIGDSSAVVGQVTHEAAPATGLRAGTPVVGGMFDVSAGALGAGVIAPGHACITAGTWSVNAVVTDTPIASRRSLFNALYTPDSWLTIDASPSSSANLEWFVTEL